jgi:hypothetical protein
MVGEQDREPDQDKPRKVRTKRQQQGGRTFQTKGARPLTSGLPNWHGALNNPNKKIKANTAAMPKVDVTKIEHVWRNVKKKGEWEQSYHQDIDPTKSTRYVMLMFDDGWHISFYPINPNDPSEDKYRQVAKEGFENEPPYTKGDWRYDYGMMDTLKFNEFHVTSGRLHKGTAKHFFYKDDGTFIRENGKSISRKDRLYADQLRRQIVPSASKEHGADAAYMKRIKENT